jgi:hypothetical protein
MRSVRVQANGCVKLPGPIARRFRKNGELAVWAEGDTIILKRVNPPLPSEFSSRARGTAMPMDEINEEVHRYRREKGGGGA